MQFDMSRFYINWRFALSATGTILIVLAVMFLPLGSSSAVVSIDMVADSDGLPTIHGSHGHAQKSTSQPSKPDSVGHDHHHQADHDTAEHDSQSCCEGYCTGAAAFTTSAARLISAEDQQLPFALPAAVTPGEWATPHRPPNALI